MKGLMYSFILHVKSSRVFFQLAKLSVIKITWPQTLAGMKSFTRCIQLTRLVAFGMPQWSH